MANSDTRAMFDAFHASLDSAEVVKLVDVLAVMDAAQGELVQTALEIGGCDHDVGICQCSLERTTEEHRDARAVVADLIAALERALPHVEHAYHTHPDPDGALWADVMACRSALARCGGEP